jgi:hypothetical protein
MGGAETEELRDGAGDKITAKIEDWMTRARNKVV